MNCIKLSKTLNEKKHYDVIVCGGGVAGVAAAVTAAKNGNSVLLMEKSNILGGLATLGLVNLFVPMCNGRGKQIIFGLCEKWARLSIKHGYDTLPDEWKNGEPEKPTDVRYLTRFSPNIFALQLLEELSESGTDLLLDCIACDPVMEGNVCKGVITESKSGTEYYSCKVLIDVTGDCDVLRRGNVPTIAGENFFTYYARLVTLESCKEAVEKQNIYHAFTNISGGSVNLFGDNQPEDIPKWSGLKVEEVTDYLVRNHKILLEKVKQTERKSRDISHLSFMPQFRTTCHLEGDYALSVNDAYKHFDDSVCAINDFEHRDHLFEVPLRCLCRKDYPNLLTAGRSASGVGYGWDLLRVIPPAILTGQAAAHAAFLAIVDNVAVSAVNIKKLQARLEKDDIMVHFPDEYVPEDKSVVIHGKNTAFIPGGHI